MQEGARVVITAKTRLLKFDEGQDPQKDEPVEVVEHTQVLEGQEAEKLLKQMKGAS